MRYHRYHFSTLYGSQLEANLQLSACQGISVHSPNVAISQVLHCLSPPAVDRAGGGAGRWRVREAVRVMKDPGRALELMLSARMQGEWCGYVHTQCRGRERALFGNFRLSGCPALLYLKNGTRKFKVQSIVCS